MFRPLILALTLAAPVTVQAQQGLRPIEQSYGAWNGPRPFMVVCPSLRILMEPGNPLAAVELPGGTQMFRLDMGDSPGRWVLTRGTQQRFVYDDDTGSVSVVGAPSERCRRQEG